MYRQAKSFEYSYLNYMANKRRYYDLGHCEEEDKKVRFQKENKKVPPNFERKFSEFMNYKEYISLFLFSQRMRLEKSHKRDCLTMLTSSVDYKCASLSDLREIARHTHEAIRKHRDTGWLGFFKLTWLRKTRAEKEFNKYFDKDYNLKIAIN